MLLVVWQRGKSIYDIFATRAGQLLFAFVRRSPADFSETLQQQFVIDAKPGASGNIAALQLVRPKSDGSNAVLDDKHILGQHVSFEQAFLPLASMTTAKN
jgi:tripartite-type tricarboxylate transporter receptor subunit TctC